MFFKLLRYDLRNGLLRWRYLSAVLIFVMPCFSCWFRILPHHGSGTWADWMLYCFKGVFPPGDQLEGFEFPILWFVTIVGGLFISLDYPLNDLTDVGQQIIIRTVSRKKWFFSKCIWNLLSYGLYFLIGSLTVLIAVLTAGGGMELTATPDFMNEVVGVHLECSPPVWETVFVAMVLPYLTVTAYGMLQMVLCLVIKPIYSFLTCICLLTCSLFASSPFILGNGAMAARSSLVEGGHDPAITALVCLLVIMLSAVIGTIRFRRMDLLHYEG